MRTSSRKFVTSNFKYYIIISIGVFLTVQSTLFKDAPEEFMRMLSLVAEQQLYLPSQVIINKGDVGQHMYIITRGEAEVYICTLIHSAWLKLSFYIGDLWRWRGCSYYERRQSVWRGENNHCT